MTNPAAPGPPRARGSLSGRVALHSAFLLPALLFAIHLVVARFSEDGRWVWWGGDLAVVASPRDIGLVLGDFVTPMRIENHRRNRERIAAALATDPYLPEDQILAQSANIDPRDEQIAKCAADGLGTPIEQRSLGLGVIVSSSYAVTGLTFVRFDAAATLIVLLTPWLLVFAVRGVMTFARRHSVEIDRCAACGYQIGTALEPRCPECGQLFDEATRAFLIGKNAEVPLEAIWEERK